MFIKYLTLGKIILARMYFRMNAEQDNLTLDQLDNNATDIIDAQPKKNKQL
jgi:hypothetical protein